MKKCKYCQSEIDAKAKVCPICKKKLGMPKWLVILIVLIVILLPKGLMALATSWVLYILATLLISVILSSKLVKYNLLNFLKDTVPYMLIALISSSISYLTTKNINPPILFITINILIIATLYITTCKLLKLEMIKEIEVWFTKRRKNK